MKNDSEVSTDTFVPNAASHTMLLIQQRTKGLTYRQSSSLPGNTDISLPSIYGKLNVMPQAAFATTQQISAMKSFHSPNVKPMKDRHILLYILKMVSNKKTAASQ